jgi:hypothetical protein
MRIYLDCCSLQRPFVHLASASVSKVDYFCTCDDKFLKKARSFERLNTKVVFPIELVMELEI